MAPQPSPVRKFPLEDAGEIGSLIFGAASPTSLTIPKELIANIWGQVNEGIRILPRGGAEVGGLLVGPKSRTSGIVVDRIIPLPIEYEHGPSFRMSASDIAKVAALVASVQVDPTKAIIGFYRSQTRGNEMFRDSDREILDAIELKRSSFAADSLCYLVLAPVSKSEMLACISMWNGNDWDGIEFRLRSNPFSVDAVRPSIAPKASAAAGLNVSHPTAAKTEAKLVPPVQQTIPQPAAEDRATPSVRRLDSVALSARWLYAVAGLLVLAIAVAGFRWIVQSRPDSPTNSRAQTGVPASRMGFSASREGPVWKLSWDRAAIDAMKLGGAVLDIKDGNSEQHLNLTPADLSNGTIFYTPQSSDLVFSLQLDRGGTPFEEHVRVLEGPRSVQKSPEPGQQTPSNNTIVQPATSSPAPTLPTEPSRETASGTVKETPVNRILRTFRPTPAPAETKVLPTILSDAPPSFAETAPPLAVAFAVPVAPRLEPPVVREILPPSAPVPQTAANPGAAAKSAPANGAATPATLTSTPLAAPVKPNYIGPKPVQQVRPQPPANLNSSGVQIQVRVEIDARGNVTKADAVGVTAANFRLVSVTLRAARVWQFEPAKMDGRPVPSEMDLLFRF